MQHSPIYIAMARGMCMCIVAVPAGKKESRPDVPFPLLEILTLSIVTTLLAVLHAYLLFWDCTILMLAKLCCILILHNCMVSISAGLVYKDFLERRLAAPLAESAQMV